MAADSASAIIPNANPSITASSDVAAISATPVPGSTKTAPNAAPPTSKATAMSRCATTTTAFDETTPRRVIGWANNAVAVPSRSSPAMAADPPEMPMRSITMGAIMPKVAPMM